MGAGASTFSATETIIYQRFSAKNIDFIEKWLSHGLPSFTGADDFTTANREKFKAVLEKLKLLHERSIKAFYDGRIRVGSDESHLENLILNHFDTTLRKEELLLQDLGKNKLRMLLVIPAGHTLIVKCFEYSNMLSCASEVKVLSYRWNMPAVAFQKYFDWADALYQIATSDEFTISMPSDDIAKTFYESLVNMFQRTGIKYLWIDQLCIPQDMPPYTMAIVQACGSFYREFEVLIWVPWILLSDEDLKVYQDQIQDAEDREDDNFFIEVLGGDISSLYSQCARAWILREMSAFCRAMKLENQRNLDFLWFINQLLENSTIPRHHRTQMANSNVARQLVKLWTITTSVWMNLIDMQGDLNPESDILMAQAAKVTVAPFTVSTDRYIVAFLESYVPAVKVHSTCLGWDIYKSVATVIDKDQTRIRLFTYLGSRAYEKVGQTSVLFKDWPEYEFDPAACKLIMDYLLTVSQFAVLFTEEQSGLLDKLLRRKSAIESLTFTAYLPANEATLLDSHSGCSSDLSFMSSINGECCFIMIGDGFCSFIRRAPNSNGTVTSFWNDEEYIIVDESVVQADRFDFTVEKFAVFCH